MGIMENYNSSGIGLALATFSYKIAPFTFITYFILYFMQGHWGMPFLYFFGGVILSMLIMRLFTMTGLLPKNSKDSSLFTMTLSGVILLLAQVCLLNNAFSLTH